MTRPFVLNPSFSFTTGGSLLSVIFVESTMLCFPLIFLVLLVCTGPHLALFSPHPSVLVWCSFLSSAVL